MKELWQTNKYIPLFGRRFYYKLSLLHFGDMLGLPFYRNWKTRKNVLKRKGKKINKFPSNPNFSASKKRQLIIRDGEFCQNCGTDKHLTVDHIVEACISKNHTLENLQLLCLKCHDEKTRKFNRWYETEGKLKLKQI